AAGGPGIAEAIVGLIAGDHGAERLAFLRGAGDRHRNAGGGVDHGRAGGGLGIAAAVVFGGGGDRQRDGAAFVALGDDVAGGGAERVAAGGPGIAEAIVGTLARRPRG